MGIPVFWLEPTEDRVRVELRRYVSTSERSCRSSEYCDASAVIEWVAPAADWKGVGPHAVPHDDPRWPSRCEACGEPLPATSIYQVNARKLFRAPDGALLTLRDAPAGAMWNAEWFPDSWKLEDGICLVVRLPNGNEWLVDGQASNCTMRDDWPRHRCWVRHGDPRDPQGERSGVKLHVDKKGVTCAAGAGSIGSGKGPSYYHGFLHHGELRPT